MDERIDIGPDSVKLGELAHRVEGLPQVVIDDEDALTGCLIGFTADPLDPRPVYLVDVVDREPPGTYRAWGVL
jgi:hypothetical protein